MAHDIELREQDGLLYLMGIYNKIAFAQALWGKKSRVEYPEKPLLQQAEAEKHATEDNLRKQRELFVAKLLTMQANFEISRKTKEREQNN